MRYQYKDPSRTVICMTCVYLDLGPEPDVWSELLFPFHYFISWYHSCAWVASDFLSCESERTATQFQKLVPGGSGGFPWGTGCVESLAESFPAGSAGRFACVCTGRQGVSICHS